MRKLFKEILIIFYVGQKIKLILCETLAEAVIRKHYLKEKLIVCGICGNFTPEKSYLKNNCFHCGLGIDYEVGTLDEEIRVQRKLEKSLKETTLIIKI